MLALLLAAADRELPWEPLLLAEPELQREAPAEELGELEASELPLLLPQALPSSTEALLLALPRGLPVAEDAAELDC